MAGAKRTAAIFGGFPWDSYHQLSSIPAGAGHGCGPSTVVTGWFLDVFLNVARLSLLFDLGSWVSFIEGVNFWSSTHRPPLVGFGPV